MTFIALIIATFIILCSYINHLGGQSTSIPDPRIVCRVIAIPALFALTGLIIGVYPISSLVLFAIAVAGMAFWAVWSNGAEFMSINATDYRNYNTPWYEPNYALTRISDAMLGVSQLTKLSPAQCKNWGTLYGTLLGLFIYPLFASLGYVLTPWAYIIGTFCLLQGIVYRISGQVLIAEYIYGGMIGVALGSVLIMRGYFGV